MKKIVITFALSILLLAISCTQKYRINSAAMLDRSPRMDYGMIEIAETLRAHAVNVVDEDSIEYALGQKEVAIRKGLLCAGYRGERLNSAVSLGKELGADAVIFSSMPPAGMKTQMSPCLSESLISFFIVDPPIVLFETRNYYDFIYNMSSINWEVVVSPPPEPEEFSLLLNDELKYAGLKLSVLPNDELSETGKDAGESNRRGTPSGGSRDFNEDEKKDENEEETDEKIEDSGDTGSELPWLFIVEEDYHTIHSEAFEKRIVGSIAGKLEYDVSSAGTADEPRFKLVLTDLRIN